MQPAKGGIAVAYDADLKVKTFVFERGNDKYPDKDHPVSAAFPEILHSSPSKIETIRLPAAAWNPGFRPEIRKELLQAAETLIKKRIVELQKAERALANLILTANKGVAHSTAEMFEDADQLRLLEIGSRGVPSLIISYFYTPLKLRAPNYKIRSRPRTDI